MIRLLPLLTASLIASGCAVPTSVPPFPGPPTVAPEPPPDDCGASGRQVLIDQPLSAFDRTTVTGPLRIIPPGAPVTMDYSPARLNVETDARGRIVRITCG